MSPYDSDSLESESPEEEQEEELSDADLVARAKECYRAGIDATAKWREDALEDLQFLAGEQWDQNIKGQRDAQGRPALTVNRLPQFVRQVTNEQRQSRPSVTVSPVDSSGDIKTAEVLQGIIRNVEYTSNADAAYAAGGQSAAVTGLGYWDVCAEYDDEKSFEQRLVIRRIPNPLSVVMDPGAKELAGDDARWCVISTDLSKGEWKSLFPDRETPSSTGWAGQGDSAASWVGQEGVRIHEYRYVTDEPDTLIEVPAQLFEDLPEGGAALESELEPAVAQALLAQGANTRRTTRRTVRWAKIAGNEVIEKGEFAGRYLQLVRVVGTELEIDGTTIYEGVIRHAKDTQRMLNYFVSAEAEAIALAPKAPFVGTAKQIEGYEKVWESANQRPASFLPYNADPAAPGPPQRVMAEANVQAITNARMQAADDLKAVTGIYDAALGARSNETSGRAVLARESQAQTSNFHFSDNLAMAIRYTGRILIDLIPHIYSGPRVLRILGEDTTTQEMVPVNQPGQFRGEEVQIQLDAGRYDVSVSMGPSYHSRRQQAAAQLTELAKMAPAVMGAAGDLVIKTLDIPGGNEIAKRIAKTLPPELRPPDEGQPPPQILAQQLQQAHQMVEQLTARVNEMQQERETHELDNASKERIALLNARVELAKLDSGERTALLQEASAMSRQLGLTEVEPQNGAMNVPG